MIRNCRKHVIDFTNYLLVPDVTLYDHKMLKLHLAPHNIYDFLENTKKYKNIKVVKCDKFLPIIPRKLQLLPELEILICNDNEYITSLSKSICRLHNLTRIIMRNNKNLTKIHPNIYLLKNLKELDISNNNLTELPSTLKQLEKLIYCNTSNNFLLKN